MSKVEEVRASVCIYMHSMHLGAHACAHTRTHARTHACMHTHTHTHTHARTCMHVRTHARTHARMHAHAHARMHARTHARTHARMHAHTRAHAHARTCMHARTDARTHARAQVYVFCCAHAEQITAYLAASKWAHSKEMQVVPVVSTSCFSAGEALRLIDQKVGGWVSAGDGVPAGQCGAARGQEHVVRSKAAPHAHDCSTSPMTPNPPVPRRTSSRMTLCSSAATPCATSTWRRTLRRTARAGRRTRMRFSPWCARGGKGRPGWGNRVCTKSCSCLGQPSLAPAPEPSPAPLPLLTPHPATPHAPHAAEHTTYKARHASHDTHSAPRTQCAAQHTRNTQHAHHTTHETRRTLHPAARSWPRPRSTHCSGCAWAGGRR